MAKYSLTTLDKQKCDEDEIEQHVTSGPLRKLALWGFARLKLALGGVGKS